MKFGKFLKVLSLSVCMSIAMIFPGCMLNMNEYKYQPTAGSSAATDTVITTEPVKGSVTDSDSDFSAESSESETIPSSLHMDPPDVDTEAPVFISYPRTINLLKGKEFIPGDYVGYIDDVDRDVDFKVTGEVDVNTKGDYPIQMTITDDAGNSKTIDVTVKVYTKTTATKKPTSSTSKPSNSTTKAKKTTFADLKAKYATGNSFIGIDVSKYQGNINFNKVKDAGCHFVILRAAIYNNGKFGIDSKFEQYYKDAKAAGLLIGVYYYSVDNTPELMKQHCAELAKALKGKEIDLPVAYDFEKWKGFQNLKMNSSDLNNMFYLFCSEMESYGYETMIYANPYFLRNWFKPGGHKIWLADWKKQPSYAGTIHFWQFSATGRIDGIQGNVDVDIYYPGARVIEAKKENSNG